MEPTIQNSDIVFAENLSRHFYGIQRGDIVIAKSPSDPKSNICKRVIGLEGDKILTTSPSDFFKSHSYVPRGHVWLEGDNLQNSTDSRYYGPIPYGLIRGRIFFKLQRKSETSLHTTQLWRKGHKRTQQGSCLHKDRTDQHHPELLSLQNYEKFCLAAQSVVFCYGSPSRLMGILQIKQDQAKSASKNKALQKCKGLLVICS
ncbi:mitochondrial inner membrane protease subunit 1 isoform X2 [Nannospalax galili]|nr:mitochondrial inner membrane protease subunit 1 isoform X2 [Nannospalax galili]